MFRPILATILLIALTRTVAAPAAQIAAQPSERGVTVKIDGQLFTEYLTQSGTKPVLWPILGPTGKPMTRAWPMETSGKETKDHVHQRSLWFTHGNVNGVDFWAELPAGKTGIIRHRQFVKIQSGPEAVIITRNDWQSPTGTKVCEDERALTFGTDGPTRWIDFQITLKATAGPIRFGDTKEGTLGIRVAEPLRVESKQGGHIINSRGQVDGRTWGQPAEWVDYYGPLNGQTVGIAILNHPSSFRFPTGWHVRTYGLFAANPFAQKEFSGKTDSKDTSYTLPAGEEMTLRYRFLFHVGDPKQGKVAEAFTAYGKKQ